MSSIIDKIALKSFDKVEINPPRSEAGVHKSKERAENLEQLFSDLVGLAR